MSAAQPPATSTVPEPREITVTSEPSDRIFRRVATAVGVSVLVVTGAIALFLGYQSIPTLHHYGLGFFAESQWQPEMDRIGISAVLLGTVEVALVAMVVSFPLALLFALFISQYAPVWLKGWLISVVDLMAAVPSIIYGLWGFYLLMPHAITIAHWLSQHFGWLPIFKVNTDVNAPVWQQSSYTSSAFIAGLAVSMMAIPLACAVMRAVFDQTPIGEREGAMALGATRWGVITKVILPFGKGGIIGGTMLALGRALGETAAVLIIISPAYDLKIRILETGTQTTSALIAGNFGNATRAQLSALLTAGFVLFLITLLVNTLAAVVINRSRGGQLSEI